MRMTTNLFICVAITFFFAAMPALATDEASLPEGASGFSGQVRGLVSAKGDNHNFRFKIARVLRVWKNNNASRPDALVGKTVRVGPRWLPGKSGNWHPFELHVKFIERLEVGSEITLEIQNHELAHFSILELSQEQRAWAQGERERRAEQEDSASDEQRRRIHELEQRCRAQQERLERYARASHELEVLIKKLRAENEALRRELEQLHKD